MKKVDLLIFDLDGTLIDSRADLTASIYYALKTLGIEKCPPQNIYRELKKGSSVTMRNCVRGANALDYYGQAVNLFKAHYAEHLLDHTVLYPDVIDTFEWFRGKKKAIVTNKFQEFAETIVKNMNIIGQFDLILGGDILPFEKPSPELIFHVIDSLNIVPDRTVMVGDTALDIDMGKGAGVHTCGVTYGFGPREDLERAGADIIIDKISDLTRYFS
jgi:phosphoglycolate phosphatase